MRSKVSRAYRMAAIAWNQSVWSEAYSLFPRRAAERVEAAVLLIRSREDERITYQHSLEIRAALASPADLMLLDGPAT